MTLGTKQTTIRFAQNARRFLLMTAAMLVASPSLAQTAQAALEKDEAADKEIVVTGSLVSRNGFGAPTPLTVIGLGDIQRVSAPNIADVLNQMPALRPSLTPTSAVNAGGGTQVGGNYLDLRGLGFSRTMVLLDGRRYVPSNPTGAININNIPQALINRVDIVTGGASAAYGADAVAGVVNLRIDSRLEGIRATLQGGMAEEGDFRQALISVAAGTKIGQRMHLVVGAEFSDNSGIARLFDRKWSARGPGLLANPAAGNGGLGSPEQPRFFVVDGGIRSSNVTRNGVISGATFLPGFGSTITNINLLPGTLRGIQFSDQGTAIPFTFGTQVSAGSMIGGDGLNGIGEQVGATPINRYSGFGRLTYEISNNIEVFAEVSYHKFQSEQDNIPTSFQYSLKSDNVFLPASLRSTLQQNNVSTIAIGKNNFDHRRIFTYYSTETIQTSTGINAEIASGWNFSAYYSYGKNIINNRSINNGILANYTLALDAIDDPRTLGVVDPICRSTITNSTNGCIPFNALGVVSPSNPALKYLNGDSLNYNQIQQNIVAATVRGSPFSTWAGPVSIAVGGEYRNQKLETRTDPLSRAGAFGAPVIPYRGEVTVKEGFGEVLIPLLQDSPMGKRLGLDLAVRITDYSTSGQVETWKGGIDYAINDTVRLRATRSRDIRAPNLAELFQLSGSSNLNVTDFDPRFLGQSYLVTALTAGNRNLQPEVADTFTGGIVLTPSFIPRLSLSIDYYDIVIRDAIIQITPAAVVQQCFTVNTAACGSITRDPNGRITSVFSGPLNLARALTRGIDFELQYTIPVGSNRIAVQALVNHLLKTELNDGITRTRLDYSMAQPTVAGLGGNPRWKANLNASFIADNYRISTTARINGGGFIDRTFRDRDIDRQRVKGRFYVDLSGEVTLFRPRGIDSKVALFAAVQNLLDSDPPITGGGGYGTTRSLFDTIGRQYIAGLRATL